MRVFAILACVVAGCASHDFGPQVEAVELRPTDKAGVYVYKAYADAYWTVDGEGAEKARMAGLETRLSMNGLCPAGYSVSDRRVIKAGGPHHDIFYTVACN